MNVDELNNILNRKRPTSPGIDKITYKLINNLNLKWKEKVCYLINKDNNKQEQSDDINVKIVPIAKGNSNEISNFRPIALIPVLMKITNSYINNAISTIYNENHIIPKNSFAYQKNKNTIKAIEKLIQIIIDNKNNNKSSIIIYLDFSSAYSSVEHQKLSEILQEYKFPITIVKWIENLLGRLILSINCQDGVVKRELTEGILQGSVISPVLFNIYTASIHMLQEENCKIIQYADDFCIVFGLGDNKARDSTIQDKIDQLEQIFKYLNLKLITLKQNYNNSREQIEWIRISLSILS